MLNSAEEYSVQPKTSNPKWDEFKACMNPEISSNPMDYADLLNRIFIDKDQRMLKELTEFHIMGQHLGHSRSIEFQKRVKEDVRRF